VEFVGRNGVRVAYRKGGTGPFVLLTHGYGASSHMFDSNAAALADCRTVVAWDLRGHGATDSPADPAAYTREASIADMAAILDDVGADRAVVGGHSLGGYLSLLFALEHPERTDGLVLIDTGPGFRKAEGRAKWNQIAERYAVSLTKHGLAGLPGSAELTADVHRDASGLILAARGILSQHDSRVIDSLADIEVPALVIIGEDDEMFMPGSLYMAEKLPNGDLVVIPGAGHAPNMTHAAQFDAALRSFLVDRS
jgi:pimeloyl-ACP methyl ester carboxylesterase